jgi:quinol monooxygenase YgiN
MSIGRRQLLTGIAAMAVPSSSAEEVHNMYGLIVKITAVSGKRDTLISVLIAGTAEMPGCINYIIAKDSSDEDAIWVTEIWDSKASHDASLSLPAVKEAIAKGRPLIATFGTPVITTPIGGRGLTTP